MRLTQEFFRFAATRLNLVTSRMAEDEIRHTSDEQHRTTILKTLSGLRVEPVSADMDQLARALIEAGIFREDIINDAVHIAAATLLGCDVIASWNFKHLVNRRRKQLVNLLLASRGHRKMEIVAPPELIEEADG